MKKNPKEVDLNNAIIPLLKKITNYSSYGVKYITKGTNFGLNHLPREFKNYTERLEGIVGLLSDHANNYVDACKLIYISLNFLEHTKNTKLEMVLKCKLDEVTALEDRLAALPNNLTSHEKSLKLRLEKDIQSYQEEIKILHEGLQKNLEKWKEKAVPTSLSTLKVVLKLVRSNCDKKNRPYLSNLISFLTFCTDVFGACHGWGKLKKTLGKLWSYRNEVHALNEQIKNLEMAKLSFTSSQQQHIACEKCIRTLKTRLVFLKNIKVHHQIEKLTINGLKFIRDTASVLGAVGALFVFTSVVAGAISTFGVWTSIICGIISALIYLRDHPIKFNIFLEDPEKLKEKLFSEIISKRIEIKSIELTRDSVLKQWNKRKEEMNKIIKENQEKLEQKNNITSSPLNNSTNYYQNDIESQIEENNKKIISLNTQVGDLDNLKKKIDLQLEQINLEFSERLVQIEKDHGINLFNDKNNNIDNDKDDKDNHSFIDAIDLHKEKQIDNKRKEAIAKDFGLKGTVEDYDRWAQEILEYIEDNEYRNILNEVLGLKLDENSKNAFNQIEYFIRH